MNKSIVINESKILAAVEAMCQESLPPNLYEAWREVANCLIKIRHGFVSTDETADNLLVGIKIKFNDETVEEMEQSFQTEARIREIVRSELINLGVIVLRNAMD